MAIGVLLALVGGTLMGRLSSVARTMTGVITQSCVVLVVVAFLAAEAGAGGMAAMFAIAAFMFSSVIGTAVALLTRRVLRERQKHAG